MSNIETRKLMNILLLDHKDKRSVIYKIWRTISQGLLYKITIRTVRATRANREFRVSGCEFGVTGSEFRGSDNLLLRNFYQNYM